MPICCCDWFVSYRVAEIAADWLQIHLRGGIPEARHNAWPADLVWAFEWEWGEMWGVLWLGLHSGWRVTQSVWQYIWSDGEFQQQSNKPAHLIWGLSVRTSFEAVFGCSDCSSVCADGEQVASCSSSGVNVIPKWFRDKINRRLFIVESNIQQKLMWCFSSLLVRWSGFPSKFQSLKDKTLFVLQQTAFPFEPQWAKITKSEFYTENRKRQMCVTSVTRATCEPFLTGIKPQHRTWTVDSVPHRSCMDVNHDTLSGGVLDLSSADVAVKRFIRFINVALHLFNKTCQQLITFVTEGWFRAISTPEETGYL